MPFPQKRHWSGRRRPRLQVMFHGAGTDSNEQSNSYLARSPDLAWSSRRRLRLQVGFTSGSNEHSRRSVGRFPRNGLEELPRATIATLKVVDPR